MTELTLRFEEIINLNSLINNHVNAIDDFPLQFASSESHLSIQRAAKLIESRQIQEAELHYVKNKKTDEIEYRTQMIDGKLENVEPKIISIDAYNEWYLKFMDNTGKVQVMQMTYESMDAALDAIDPLKDYKNEKDRLFAKERRRAIFRNLYNKIILIKPSKKESK